MMGAINGPFRPDQARGEIGHFRSEGCGLSRSSRPLRNKVPLTISKAPTLNSVELWGLWL
jgi:hypothetical protein